MGKISQNLELHFFHGFLGRPSDWSPIVNEICEKLKLSTEQIHLHNLFSDIDSMNECSFESWVQLKKQFIIKRNKPVWFVGYSLGARLCMHLIQGLLGSKLFSGAHLCSGHYGLTNTLDKQRRLSFDQNWASKFLNQEWSLVLEEWNHQSVFNQDVKRPSRLEKNYDKNQLATALSSWSLARQDNLLSIIDNKTVFSIIGLKDKKYVQLYSQLNSQNNIHYINSGHSSVFTHSKEVATIIANDLLKLERVV